MNLATIQKQKKVHINIQHKVAFQNSDYHKTMHRLKIGLQWIECTTTLKHAFRKSNSHF